MIMQCGACGHLFKRSNPSTAWENNLRLSRCPDCGVPVRPPLSAIRLVDTLLVLQFLALMLLSDSIFFRSAQLAEIYIASLLVFSLLLYLLDSGKGQPFLLKRRGRHARVRGEAIDR